MENFRIIVGSKACTIEDVGWIIHKEKCPVLFDNWSDFARGLGIESIGIKEFRQKRQLDKFTHSDLIHEVLEQWVAATGSGATLVALLRVIEEDCHSAKVGESLRVRFNLPSKSLKSKYAGSRHVIPERPSFYIGRSLITRNIISYDIFRNNSPDVFLIRDMDRSELRKLVGMDKITGDSKEQIRCTKIEPRFIILNQPSHFDKICEKIGKLKPVHLLCKETDGHLRWIQSQSDITYLQGCIDQSQDELDEDSFCQAVKTGRAPICISDSPGMGKSLLLAEVGDKLTRMLPNRRVSFIALTEFLKLVKQVGVDNVIYSITEVLTNLFGWELLTTELNSEVEVDISFELLLDGFDELDSQDHQLAYDLLKKIQHSFKSIRLWVTSRPHLLGELERHLNQLGYNIRPFQLDDQVRFLSTYWSRKTQLDREKFQHFAKCCLDALKSKLNSADQDIAGIPLQCLLIGESYADDAVDYARVGTKTDTLGVADIEIGTISNLYRNLIRNRIEKYESMETGFKLNEQKLMTIHARIGWALIFPDHVNDLEQWCDPVGESEMEQVLKVGILESSSTTKAPRFLHRTFAEYFVAWLVVDELGRKEESTSELSKCFLRVLHCQDHIELKFASFKFTYPVITYFIDSLVPGIATFSRHSDIQLLSSDYVRRVTHSCINANYVQLFNYLLSLNALDKQAGEIFDDKFLYLAIWYSCVELVKSALTLFERCHQFDLDVQVKALRTAVKRNKYSILEYLLIERNLQQLVKESHQGSFELVHDCIENSKNNTEIEIQEAKRVLRLLVEINSSLLESKGGVFKEKPLLSFGVHIHLLKELITLGVDVLDQDIQGNTVLHMNYIRNHLSSKDYDELVQIIGKEHLKKLALIKGEGQDTPLLSILRWMDPSQETLQTFHEAGASFNSIDEKEYSILEIAIRNGRMTTNLIRFGAKINRKPLRWIAGKLGRKTKPKGRKTLLHYAAQNGNVEAVDVLLENKRTDVNLKDEDDLTPLDLAVRSWKKNREYSEIAMSLQNRGGSLTTHVSTEGTSLLQDAVDKSDIQLVRLLINDRIDVNFQNSDGDTAMHNVARYRDDESKTDNFLILQSLLENGANPKILNRDSDTPISIVLKGNTKKFMVFLECLVAPLPASIIPVIMKAAMSNEYTLDSEHLLLLARDTVNSESGINCQDSNGNSLLHIVTKEGMKSVVSFLISSGADVNLKNKRKETPLHLASCLMNKTLSLELIQILIEELANPYDVDDDVFAVSFLQHYIGYGTKFHPSASEFHQMVEYLTSNRLSNLFNLNYGYDYSTPLCDAISLLKLEEKTLSILHSNDVDFNAVDGLGNSVLFHSVNRNGHNSIKLIDALIHQFGANQKHLNNDKWSLLHYAASWGHPEALEYILALKVLDVNGLDKNGNIPLHMICFPFYITSPIQKCKLLIDHGADVNIINNNGETPWARAKNKLDKLDIHNERVDKAELLHMLQPTL